MDLSDTVDGMVSDDWQERLKAECQQIGIRLLRLNKYYNGLLKDGDREELSDVACQMQAMISYQKALVRRMKRAGIIIT